jgi:hypothetical protein
MRRLQQLRDAGQHLQSQARVAYVLLEVRVHRSLQLGQLAHRLHKVVMVGENLSPCERLGQDEGLICWGYLRSSIKHT